MERNFLNPELSFKENVDNDNFYYKIDNRKEATLPLDALLISPIATGVKAGATAAGATAAFGPTALIIGASAAAVGAITAIGAGVYKAIKKHKERKLMEEGMRIEQAIAQAHPSVRSQIQYMVEEELFKKHPSFHLYDDKEKMKAYYKTLVNVAKKLK